MDNTQKKTIAPLSLTDLTETVTRLDWNSDNAVRQRRLMRERIENIETTSTQLNNRTESHAAILHPAGAFAARINGIETDIKHAVADIATVRTNADDAYRVRGHLTERIVDVTEHANTLGARQEDIIATASSATAYVETLRARISRNEDSIGDIGTDLVGYRIRLDSLAADRDVHTKAIDAMTRRVSTLEQHVPQRLMEHSAAIARTRETLDAVDIGAAVDARVGELCRIAAVGIVLLSAVFVAAATAGVGIVRFLSMFLY